MGCDNPSSQKDSEDAKQESQDTTQRSHKDIQSGSIVLGKTASSVFVSL